MRFAALSLLSLPIFAAATAIPVTSRDECSGGTINCCNSTQTSTAANLASLGGLLGISLPNLGGLIGLTCSSIAALAAANQGCSSQQVCCSGNSFNGLIALGCIAINV